MLRAGLLLIIRRYLEIGICHAFTRMLAGCLQDPANSQPTETHDIYQLLYIQSSAS